MIGSERTNVLKVITVDDSPIIAERIKAILNEVEQVVFLGNATNFSEALLLIERNQPDVVIVDIHLDAANSDGNGIQLLSILRKKYSELKIIIFTNHNDLHYRLASIASGADFFLDKSYDFNRIPEILHKWTQKK